MQTQRLVSIGTKKQFSDTYFRGTGSSHFLMGNGCFLNHGWRLKMCGWGEYKNFRAQDVQKPSFTNEHAPLLGK